MTSDDVWRRWLEMQGIERPRAGVPRAPRQYWQTAPPPTFSNRCVQLAYEAIERRVINDFRRREQVSAHYHQDPLETLRMIDSAWREPDGFVYMAAHDPHDGEDVIDLGKIGYSTDPDVRLRQLQTGSAIRLGFSCVVPGTMSIEAAMHKYLSSERAHGEWFHLNGKPEWTMHYLWMVTEFWGLLRSGTVL